MPRLWLLCFLVDSFKVILCGLLHLIILFLINYLIYFSFWNSLWKYLFHNLSKFRIFFFWIEKNKVSDSHGFCNETLVKICCWTWISFTTDWWERLHSNAHLFSHRLISLILIDCDSSLWFKCISVMFVMCFLQASKRKNREPKEENVTLGPAVREGEHVFGVAHIFASFNDTFIVSLVYLYI